MKITQLAGVIVTSMVVILMVVSVLMPIIQETDTTRYITSENEGEDYRMAMGDGTFAQLITIESIGESSATYIIGSSTKTVTGEDQIVWIWDNGVIRMMSDGMHVLTTNVSYQEYTFNNATDYVEFSAGTLKTRHDVGTESEGGRTSPYTWVLYPSDNGNWGAFSGSFNLNIAGKYYAMFVRPGVSVVGFGTATSMSSLVINNSTTATWSTTFTPNDTYNTVEGCACSFTIGQNTASGATSVNIAPMEYISGSDGGEIVQTLIGIIPVLIIVGVVMFVVGAYVRGRDY